MPDPEVPVLTIDDLGILRDVTVHGDRVEVTITPTYSGCPAMDTIRADIEQTLHTHGWKEVVVRTVLAPAWTTEWMSSEGRRKLREFGIAPPGPVDPGGLTPLRMADAVACPRCGSLDTTLLSRFSSTACKALRRCNRCLEPFDHFKPH